MRSLKLFAVAAALAALVAGPVMAQDALTTTTPDTAVTAPAVDTGKDTVKKHVMKKKAPAKKHVAKKHVKETAKTSEGVAVDK